jgi:hypothetical protein
MRRASEAFGVKFGLDFRTLMAFSMVHLFAESPALRPPLVSHFFAFQLRRDVRDSGILVVFLSVWAILCDQ